MNQHLLDELIAMKRSDADVRSRLVQEEQLYCGYADEMQQDEKNYRYLNTSLKNKYT